MNKWMQDPIVQILLMVLGLVTGMAATIVWVALVTKNPLLFFTLPATLIVLIAVRIWYLKRKEEPRGIRDFWAGYAGPDKQKLCPNHFKEWNGQQLYHQYEHDRCIWCEKPRPLDE